jgi:hypothetical protein
MKRKILALGLVSLCWLGLAAGESQAFFGLFNCWHCNKYTTQITCRPYNAFTPICWGNLVCDGCCPNPCGVANGCLPMTMGVPPWACGQGCCPSYGGGCSPSFGGGCCASDMPVMNTVPAPAPSGGAAPPYTGPNPMPVGPNMTMGYPYAPMMRYPYPPAMPSMPMAPNATVGYPPMLPPAPNTTMMYPQMNPNISQAGYYPNYYAPSYYPYAGYQQPMPYYWYGAGR